MKSRFIQEQIIGIFTEHQAGLSAAELCRKHGVRDATFYKWQVWRHGGVEGQAAAFYTPDHSGGQQEREETVSVPALE